MRDLLISALCYATSLLDRFGGIPGNANPVTGKQPLASDPRLDPGRKRKPIVTVRFRIRLIDHLESRGRTWIKRAESEEKIAMDGDQQDEKKNNQSAEHILDTFFRLHHCWGNNEQAGRFLLATMWSTLQIFGSKAIWATVAVCEAAGEGIGARLVRNGWRLDSTQACYIGNEWPSAFMYAIPDWRDWR